MTARSLPIGVFDSGVGGLSVLRALRQAMPREDFIYLGDTARLPYGTKSAATVRRYSLQCAAVLAARGICGLVVACNTASASALPALQAQYPKLPIIGVIEAGAEAAVAASKSQHIAVIATEGTISGGAYQAAILAISPHARIRAGACSLFVALAEEGLTTGPIAEAIAHRYLDPIFRGDDPPDTLVLGCTHFPALAPAIRGVLPSTVEVVDSAVTTATAARRLFPLKASREQGRVAWLATDDAARFARIGSFFLGEIVPSEAVEIVDIQAR